MNTLVIGSSHINSLRSALDRAPRDFGTVEFSTSSLWCLKAFGTKIHDGRLALAQNPIEFFECLTPHAKIEPFPNFAGSFLYRRDDGRSNILYSNMRDFYDPGKPGVQQSSGRSVDIVIVIFYVSPRTDPMWIQKFSDVDPDCPISVSVAENIAGLGGRATPREPMLWGAHVFEGEPIAPIFEEFSLIETLKQIRVLYPNAIKMLCVPPPIFPFADIQIPLLKPKAHGRLLEAYASILRRLYAALDFRICMFPAECLDETRAFTKLDWSLKPEVRDQHMNEAYGALLWRDLGKVASAS